jgi:hypothetical protein
MAMLAVAMLAACSQMHEEGPQSGAPGGPGGAMTAAAPRAAAVSRKLIHEASLELESARPADTLRAISALAEGKGGFLASSTTSRSGSGEVITVVLRVPARDFQGALESLRGAGRVLHERLSAQDVTEEWVDVEARLRASRALEAQYLEILKQATTVKDTLDVQQKLGEVRTEIERVEGRQRVLQDQVELATITVRIDAAETTAGLVESLGQALADARQVSAWTLHGSIRVAGVLAPFVLLFGLPIVIAVRLRRRSAHA